MENLDAMFDDMLGELDIISQQLEDKTEKSVPPKVHIDDKRASISSRSSTAEREADIDLNAMLNDLTDWEQNIVSSGPGSISTTTDQTQGSDGGFNSNSYLDTNKLSVQYNMDVSPQFNTLKRSTAGGPSVTYGDDDDHGLSLESLEKDIDQEKRQLDKSRQLSAEELAALSPVMQELDELVSDLSNLSFHDALGAKLDHNIDSSAQKEFLSTKQDCSSDVASETSSFIDKKATNSTYKHGNSSKRAHLPNTESHQKSVRTAVAASSVFKNSEFGSARQSHFEHEKQKNITSGEINIPNPLNDDHVTKARKPKPPVPPPPSSKPKLPDKPRQHSTTDLTRPKPITPVKRQTSVKAPADLSSILQRQLSQQGGVGERQAISNDLEKCPQSHIEPVANSAVVSYKSLQRHGATDAHLMNADARLGRMHSNSLVSVESNLSTTSSVTSAKSESSTESGASDFSRHSADDRSDKFVPEDIKLLLNVMHKQTDLDQPTPEAREERIRAEKMRIALEKLKEARIQKLVVKVFNKDDSSKTLVVDERMTARSVIKQLLEKNHYELSVNWALVEELPSLYMERIFEEHESVTENLSYWTRDTANQVRFVERKDKYALFRNPQHYLLSVSDTEGQMAERQKQTLIEEFFSGRSGTGVPEVQGILHIKGESKSWSRKYCVLRNSGLYCSKSGEPKKGKKLSDLQCLVMFEQVGVYLGRGWKKKHKSPTDYGFALKHPAIQTKSKHIRYFCCDDVRSLMRWIVGIRCAKYGKQLKDNFDKTNAEMKGKGDVPSVPYKAKQPDSISSASTGSGDDDANARAVPRASITNMFGGAWQRANEQEIEEKSSGEGLQRAKSVWNPSQPKSNSNWWDLGATPELEELIEDNPAPNRASYSSTDAEMSSSVQASPMPPPPVLPDPHGVQPPPPYMKFSVPSPQQKPGFSHPNPPPPAKNVHPRPPMGFGSSTPQSNVPLPLGPKPPQYKPYSQPLPPPPADDLPPPPPMDDMPPPPMEDLPLPPLDDDMPLPPPMELGTDRGLPKGLRGVDGQAPVRLPFLPMFKGGNPLANLRHPTPDGRPRGPPLPAKNFNSSNNKPPVLPREPNFGHNYQTRHKSSQPRSRAGVEVANHRGKSMVRPPLTDYYTSDVKRNVDHLYSSNDIPPAPEFIVDLKDTFHLVARSDVHSTDDPIDLPPPPPELLLNEVKSRSPLMTTKGIKPPPPKRSPNTKLSFKRK